MSQSIKKSINSRQSKFVLLCSALLLLSGCSIFSQDAEDSRPPAVLKPINPTLNVQTAWSTSIGDHAEGLAYGLAPVINDGVLYLASNNGQVKALDAKTGQLKWSTATGLSLSGGPGAGAGRIVAASNNGAVVALEASSGAEIWRTKVAGEILTAPAVSAEQVAVRAANGTLTVLNSNNGSKLWEDESEVPRLSLRGNSSPIIVSDIILSANDAGKVTSYRALDGAVGWGRLLGLPRGSTELDRLIDIDGNMALNETNLFAVGYNSRLGKLDARSGNIIWAKDYSSSTGVSVDFQNVYLSDVNGHVIAVDQETGSEKWKSDEYKYRDLSAPVATARAIVVGDLEGFVHFLSPQDGSTLARKRVSKSSIKSQPIKHDNMVYVLADNGKLLAFSISE